MSTGPDTPNPPSPPPPPAGWVPLSPPPDPYGLSNQVAREKVQLPAVFLIVVGVLNLLGALYLSFEAVTYAMMSVERFEEARQLMMQKLPFLAEYLEQQDAAQLKATNTATSAIWAVVAFVAALLTLVAGIQMRLLRYYGLAVIGAIVAALPCISCVGCCGVGEVVGIWALVILLQPDVRALFR
jgi:hypothetical protein